MTSHLLEKWLHRLLFSYFPIKMSFISTFSSDVEMFRVNLRVAKYDYLAWITSQKSIIIINKNYFLCWKITFLEKKSKKCFIFSFTVSRQMKKHYNFMWPHFSDWKTAIKWVFTEKKINITVYCCHYLSSRKIWMPILSSTNKFWEHVILAEQAWLTVWTIKILNEHQRWFIIALNDNKSTESAFLVFRLFKDKIDFLTFCCRTPLLVSR